MSDADRQRCYSEINEVVKVAMERFVAEFPEYADDDRHREALAWSVRGITRVYHILDRYIITKRQPGKGDA